MSPRAKVHALWAGVALCAALAVALWPATPPAPAPPIEPPATEPQVESPPPAEPPAPAVAVVDPAPLLRRSVTKIVDFGGEQHQFTERVYDPPFLLPEVWTFEPETHQTPEAMLASYFGAMIRADFDDWVAHFDKESQRFRVRNSTATKLDYARVWKETWRGHRILATRRIDMPGYVLIYARRQTVSPEAGEAWVPFCMKQDPSGRWLMTHDLVKHPVYGYDKMRDDVEVRVVDS